MASARLSWTFVSQFSTTHKCTNTSHANQTRSQKKKQACSRMNKNCQNLPRFKSKAKTMGQRRRGTRIAQVRNIQNVMCGIHWFSSLSPTWVRQGGCVSSFTLTGEEQGFLPRHMSLIPQRRKELIQHGVKIAEKSCSPHKRRVIFSGNESLPCQQRNTRRPRGFVWTQNLMKVLSIWRYVCCS